MPPSKSVVNSVSTLLGTELLCDTPLNVEVLSIG